MINDEQSCYAPVTVDYSPMAGTAGVVIVTSVHYTGQAPVPPTLVRPVVSLYRDTDRGGSRSAELW